MTTTADKAVTAPPVEKAKVDADKAGVRPAIAQAKRPALGRGLESLLPGPRSLGGAGTAPQGPSTGASAPASHSGIAGPSHNTAAPTGGVNSGAAHVGGSGHAALAPNDGVPVPGTVAEIQAAAARRPVDGHEVLDLPIERIDVNPHQTRSFTNIEIESLDDLADSIKVQGVLQPVTVRPGKDGRYFLITGERRMRASEMAGKKTVPAIVRVVSEQQAAEMTVIENLQRRDLTCIDLARAYVMLSKNFNMTQEQIGERVGAARETVSNYMRLVKLPDLVQRYLEQRELEFSHARVLLNLAPEIVEKVAHKAANENMSVDDLEKFLLFDPSMRGAYQPKKEAKPGGARWVDPNVRAAQRDLERILGLRVRIRDRKGKGKITLEYASLEDFDRVVGMLKGKE